MTKELFYKKVQTGGRPRYEPVKEYDSDVLDSIPYNGTTLIHSYKNGQSRKFNIKPAIAPMVAASMVLHDSLTSIISKASEFKPRNAPITPAQRKAWDALNKSFGGSITSLDGVSVHDIAESILEAISAEAEKMLTNPSIRNAYEQFLLVATLSKDNDKVDNH
jgi:hypothetical protein